MPKTRPPYSSEFRRQMVELVRAGRDPADLAREFEPSAQAIRNWVVQADRQEGRREVKPVADALGTQEREAWRARRHGPDYGAKCVSSGWSVTFSQNPRPGSPARPARCRPGLPVHEREPGRLPNRYHDARASNQGGATKLRLHLGPLELGVSKAGDYAWLHRPPSAHAVADAALLKQVRTVHASSRATHGAPRVHAELRAGGKRYGRKRIARLMRDAGLVGAPAGFDALEVYTTRPDTMFGPTFAAIAPDHPLARALAAKDPAIAAFCEECLRTGDSWAS